MVVGRRLYNYPNDVNPGLIRILEQRDNEQAKYNEQLRRLQLPLWTDYHIGAIGINLVEAASAPTRDNDDGSLLFAGDQINVIIAEMQAPHGWIAGDTIIPHIHWMRTTNSSSAILWEMRYRWSSPGTVRTAWTSWVAGTASGIPDTGTLDKELITYWTVTEPTATLSTNFIFSVRRLGDTDAENASARLIAFDTHYRADTRGSIGEYSKYS